MDALEARPRALARVLVSLGLLVQAASCATQPSTGAGEEHLPNAQAGPFREIAQPELGLSRAAPVALGDDARFTRDPTVVDLDGDPSTLPVAGYFAATLMAADASAPPDAIVRHEAPDGRSFARSSEVVLQPGSGWEGGTVGAPSALRVGAEVWLFYAAAGGIGLARSDDGLVFTREPSPVLAPARGGWERGAIPRSPGVVVLADGSFRMFYEVEQGASGSAIGEARSADGVRWERVGDSAALAPAGEGSDAGEGEPYDAGGVGDPAPVLAVSATGRPSLRVYYTARDGAGRSTIGLTARAGMDGPLRRAVAPVFGAAGASLEPRAPCVTVHPEFSLLFVTRRAGARDAQAYPVVVAGVAPADIVLPWPAAE